MSDLTRAIDATADAIQTMSAQQLNGVMVTAQETIDALARRVAELGMELAECKANLDAWRAVADRRTMQVEHERGRANVAEASRERLRAFYVTRLQIARYEKEYLTIAIDGDKVSDDLRERRDAARQRFSECCAAMLPADLEPLGIEAKEATP